MVRDRTMLVFSGLENVKKICLFEIEELSCLIPIWVLSAEWRLIPWRNDLALSPDCGKLPLML
jgi:hypothetical protein